MPPFPPVLTQQEIDQFFPAEKPDPQPQTFELALVLGGTVSAGAYTAGVLDLLIEALDAWYRQKEIEAAAPPPEEQRKAPLHDVLLEIASGASGGGVCATLLSRALQFEFPHVNTTTPRGTTNNPFYDLWVTGFTLDGLVQTHDLPSTPQKLPSLLDSTLIDVLGNAAASYVGSALGTSTSPQRRSYMRNPLRVAMTLTNLRGVPYLTTLSGIPSGTTAAGSINGEFYVNHGDFGRFAVEQPSGTPAPQPARPDEFFIPSASTAAGSAAWQQFAEYGKATGAFPLGFRARDLMRPMQHYRYRITVQPGASGQASVRPLTPAWDQLVDPSSGLLPSNYAFTVVDGGALDNEPIGLAHSWLAGEIGYNPRDSKVARRALLLVDPLASGPDLGPSTNPGLVRVIAPFIYGEVGAARYLTADMALMSDETVFSRFMITPAGSTLNSGWQIGETALAGSGLGAFAGFVHEDLRWHDYMLGRANCASFLATEFTLDATNPLFANWTPQQRLRYGTPDSTGAMHLPIIPLMDSVSGTQPLPDWPQPVINFDTLTDEIGSRLAAVIEQLETDELQSHVVLRTLVTVIRGLGSQSIAESAVAAIKDYMTSAGMQTATS